MSTTLSDHVFPWMYIMYMCSALNLIGLGWLIFVRDKILTHTLCTWYCLNIRVHCICVCVNATVFPAGKPNHMSVVIVIIVNITFATYVLHTTTKLFSRSARIIWLSMCVRCERNRDHQIVRFVVLWSFNCIFSSIVHLRSWQPDKQRGCKQPDQSIECIIVQEFGAWGSIRRMSDLNKMGEMARKNWFLMANNNSDRLIEPLLTESGQANDTREWRCSEEGEKSLPKNRCLQWEPGGCAFVFVSIHVVLCLKYTFITTSSEIVFLSFIDILIFVALNTCTYYILRIDLRGAVSGLQTHMWHMR